MRQINYKRCAKVERNNILSIGTAKSAAARFICKRVHLILLAGFFAAFLSTTAVAQDGWSFTAGAGIYGENVYLGSDAYYLTPLPSFKATYTRGEASYSISLLEGLGFTYMNRNRGFLGSLTINAGNRRNPDTYSVVGFDVDHSDKTRALLKDSPDLFTQVYVSAFFAYPTPIGFVGASAGYHPTTVQYNQDGIEDETRHGFLYSILYLVQRPITARLSFVGMSSLEFMDQTYAEAWYSVKKETSALKEFDATGGLRDAQVVLQFGYRLSARISASLVYQGTILLGDAEKSPFTVAQLQQTVGMEATYGF